jgi:hypothetical protein
MHGICFEYDLQGLNLRFQKKIQSDFIVNALEDEETFNIKPTAKIVWLGGKPLVDHFTKTKKRKFMEMTTLTFHDKKEPFSILTIKTRVNGW